MKAGRLLVGSLAGLLLVTGIYSQGCGDNGALPVEFQGNVTTVEAPGTTARKDTKRTFLVRLDLRRWKRFLEGFADAQSGACSATTRQRLTNVLACVEAGNAPAPIATATTAPTVVPTGTVTPVSTATPRPQPTVNATLVCSHVDASGCKFSTRIELAEDGEPAAVFFVEDSNGDGKPNAAELESFLVSPLPARLCNGDVIEIPDVDVNFLNGTATAGGTITKALDACPAPTGTATRTPSRTTTPGTPTPTRTGTPATPTPTRTGTPATPTATPVIAPSATPTPITVPSATPTPTRTPTPVATATSAPCLGSGQVCLGSSVPCCSGVCNVVLCQ